MTLNWYEYNLEDLILHTMCWCWNYLVAATHQEPLEPHHMERVFEILEDLQHPIQSLLEVRVCLFGSHRVLHHVL